MTVFRLCPDSASLAEAATDLVAERAVQSVRERGRFLLVLSGGRTPAPLYERLSRVAAFPWRYTHVFWGDERCVPEADPRSNRLLAEELLLSKVELPPERIHSVPACGGLPGQAVDQWEADLREFFGAVDSFPVFDLVLLGVGQDGHTASLFPGDPALDERERWASPVGGKAADPPVPRVTLTLPVINHARCVIFLAGPEKAAVVRAIREDAEDAATRYPAARVRPAGDLYWLVVGEEA